MAQVLLLIDIILMPDLSSSGGLPFDLPIDFWHSEQNTSETFPEFCSRCLVVDLGWSGFVRFGFKLTTTIQARMLMTIAGPVVEFSGPDSGIL